MMHRQQQASILADKSTTSSCVKKLRRWMLVISLIPVGVMGCGPTEAELREAQRQAEIAAAEKLEAAKPAWEKSMDFLVALDRLMADYATVHHAMAVAGSSTPNQIWIQYRIDYTWERRVSTVEEPARCVFARPCPACADRNARVGSQVWFGVGDNGDMSNAYPAPYRSCVGDRFYRWAPAKITDEYGNVEYDKKGQALYSRTMPPRPPEMMLRMEAAGMRVPERFACRVEATNVGAKGAGKQLILGCRGSTPAYVEVAGEGLTISPGDEVSVPLRDAAHDPSGVLAKVGDGRSWRIAASSETVRVDKRGD